jgi:hypothetical protein
MPTLQHSATRCNTLQHSPIGVFRHHAGIGDDVWHVRVWAEFCRSGHTASALRLLSTHSRADSLATAETARSHGHDAADNANAPVFENESMCVTPRGPATSRKSFSLFDLRSCAHAGRRRSTPACRCVAHAVWSLLHNMCCAIPVLHTPPRTLARCAERVRLQWLDEAAAGRGGCRLPVLLVLRSGALYGETAGPASALQYSASSSCACRESAPGQTGSPAHVRRQTSMVLFRCPHCPRPRP